MAKRLSSEQIIRKALESSDHRASLTIERVMPTSAEEDDRMVEMSFASDTPLTHFLWSKWEYVDIELSMEKKAVRTARLENGAAFLMDHNSGDQRGVVADFTIAKPKARAKVAIATHSRGEELLVDLRSEPCQRPQVSVGFIIHKMVLVEEREGQPDLYRAVDWEPFEISSVSSAHDISVGVDRAIRAQAMGLTDCPDCAKPLADCTCEDAGNTSSESRSKRAISQPTEKTMSDKLDNEPGTPVETRTAEQIAMQREAEIVEWAGIFGDEGKDVAREMLAKSPAATQEDVRMAIKAKRDAIPQPKIPNEDPATTAARQGGGTYQPATMVSRVGQLKAFRGKDGDVQAFRFAQFVRASLFGAQDAREFCNANGIAVKRAHSETDNETGGFLVPIEFENVMIDLRLEYGVFRRNANVVPMASNEKERPRRTGGLTAYPIGARGTNRRLTESTKGWDRVGLTARKWGVLAKYEEELADDAVIGIADDLASEIAYAFAQVEDECGFLGDGTSDYHGIIGVIPKLTGLDGTVANVAGLHECGAGHNTWPEIDLPDVLGLVGRLPSFARRTGQVKFYCTNEFWSTVLVRLALGLGGSASSDIQNDIAPKFLGRPVELVEVMPHTTAVSQVCLLYGNLSQAAMFGDRKGVTIKTTDSNDTDFEEDLMSIKGTERFDINVHDVGNASGTAADRKAGPIVGLITTAS